MSRPRVGPDELDRIAIEAAGAWIEWWGKKLRHEGRGMAGGWPGTLSEARARVAAHVASVLGDEHTLEPDMLNALTHRAYDAARKSWLSRASREPNP